MRRSVCWPRAAWWSVSPTRTCRTPTFPASPGVTATTGCRRQAAQHTRRLTSGPPAAQRSTATDFEHPFAEFFERHRTTVEYRALFAEGAAGFGEAARVIARSPGGAAVAVDLAVGGGRVVFLPALPARLSGTDRAGVASSMVTGVRNLLLLSSEGPAPAWVSGFDLAGLRDAQERVDQAETKLEGVEIELDEARDTLRGIDRYRRVLWQEGKYGLDLPVRDALALLGMTNFSRLDDAAVFSCDGLQVLVESEGSTEPVGMAPHYRLRQRLEREIEAKGQAPNGLIVINGFRDTPPASRAQQYQDALRVAAETMSYCVVEATALFEAVKAQMAGDEAGVKAFVQALLETKGVYDGPLRGGAQSAEDDTDDD